MRHASGLSMRMIQEMRKAFFDVGPDGVLIYRDPLIGTLQNAERRIGVTVDAGNGLLELRVGDRVERTFNLREGLAGACEEAFGQYFSWFEEQCRSKTAPAAAA